MKAKDLKNYHVLVKEAQNEILQNNPIRALELFDKAIAIKSGITTVFFHKAELLFSLNRDIEATRVITSLGQIEDNIAYTYMLASRYFYKQGKMQIADALYQINRDLLYGRKSFPEITPKKHLTLCSNKEQEV